jgi:hypothetical protein
MTNLLPGGEQPDHKRRSFWQLRVATLVLIGLFGLGIVLILNAKYNIGGVITAFAVGGGLYLTILRDQAERNFQKERAERADFESDRNYALLFEEQKLKKIELYLRLNPYPTAEEKKDLSDQVRPLPPKSEEQN